MKFKQYKALYFFILPGLALYLTFFVYPTFSALFYSFTNWDGLTADYDFVGLENYVNIFTNDSIFAKAFGNNLKFMLFVVIFQTLFSLIFSLYLVRNTKTNVFLRALFFFPTILSSVSVAFIWAFVYDPNLGILNTVLERANLNFLSQNWLGNEDLAIY
ncbi:carbohydrate ABC transporter permease, partial [Bacillus canaveralius]